MPYTTGIPTSGQVVSVTQPQIRDNFNILDTYLKVNHIALNLADQGKHNFVEMVARSVIPPGLSAGEGTLYTKTDTDTFTQMFYTNDNSTNEYQLTKVNDADFGTFGLATNATSGWTFLPGTTGLILQYGAVTPSATTGTVIFPRKFPTSVISLTFNYSRASTTSANSAAQNNAGVNDNTQFSYFLTSGSITQFYWMAIGI